MAVSGVGKPRNEMRRRNRSQDDAWIRAFLHSGAWGALATVSDGQPFINTNLYVFDEEAHAIDLHTARARRTRANIDRWSGKANEKAAAFPGAFWCD